jgi:elongation factor G
MTKYNVDDIRNIALVGHGAAGKTTLADHMLFKAGIGNRPGSVDDGSSLLDTDDDEKERKSTISSSLCSFEHAEKFVQMFDTPGYPDFIGQVVGPLRAVETAVLVINAPHGIEVNTRRTFKRATEEGLGKIIVLNKCDADNIKLDELILQIQEVFGAVCIPLNVPNAMGSDFTGVISTLSVPTDTNGAVLDPADINKTLLDAIVEADEALMERFFEGEALTPEEITTGISTAICAETLIPIFCVSARTGVGVDELMNGLASFAPSPSAVRRFSKAPTGESTEVDPGGEEFKAQVFKTRIDPFVSRMSFIRVYSGQLGKDTAVNSTGAKKPLKIHQLYRVQGGTQEQIDTATAGEIVAVVKMDDLSVGDTLTMNGTEAAFDPIQFPTPMVGLAVEPKSRADQSKMSGALKKIADEDPTFCVTRNEQTKEMVMRGMSELHLQIAQSKLLKRDKVEIVTHEPKIPYRETVNGTAEGSYRHKKQSGGSGQFAEVHMKIQPLPDDLDVDEYFTKARFEHLRSYHYDPDLNFAFVDRISGGSIPNQFIPAVEKGIREQMAKGILAGYEVQNCAVELFFGKYHAVDSNETAFKTASAACLREIFKKAKPVLLEPIVDIEITVPDDKLGDITSDLNTRRGRVEGMEGLAGHIQTIHAKVPLSEVMTYARSLSSMTAGRGSFTLDFSHYETVPPNEQSKIVAAAQKAKEEDS